MPIGLKEEGEEEREEEATVGCEKDLGLFSENLNAPRLHLQTCVILGKPLSLCAFLLICTVGERRQ